MAETTAPPILSTERYRVVVDEDSNPVREWADQLAFLEGMTEDERAGWLNPDQWTSHGVIRERRCICCGQWDETDSVWAFDRHDSHYDDQGDGGPLVEGTYALEELPEYARVHFTSADAEDGSSSLAFLACALMALVPVSLLVVFLSSLAGAVSGVVA